MNAKERARLSHRAREANEFTRRANAVARRLDREPQPMDASRLVATSRDTLPAHRAQGILAVVYVVHGARGGCTSFYVWDDGDVQRAEGPVNFDAHKHAMRMARAAGFRVRRGQ